MVCTKMKELLIALVGIWTSFWSGSPAKLEIRPTPIPQIQTSSFVSVGDNKYSYAFFEAGEKVKLIDNFKNRKSLADMVLDYKCRNAINGGFYDEEARPLGLVIIESTQISGDRPNSLFNGYLTQSKNNKWRITDKPIYASVHNAVQAGPLLWLDGHKRELNETQKQSRRMVAIRSNDGKLYFVTIYDEQSVLDGPSLSQLPEVIGLVAEKQKWQIESALNLDGGSASGFYNGEVWLKDWQPVGSVWCNLNAR